MDFKKFKSVICEIGFFLGTSDFNVYEEVSTKCIFVRSDEVLFILYRLHMIIMDLNSDDKLIYTVTYDLFD